LSNTDSCVVFVIDFAGPYHCHRTGWHT